MSSLRVVEICAGAGGQALGLHNAGFESLLAVELDATAAQTLRQNSTGRVVVGDVADPDVWTPSEFEGLTSSLEASLVRHFRLLESSSVPPTNATYSHGPWNRLPSFSRAPSFLRMCAVSQHLVSRATGSAFSTG
jgi:hypothetical protein